MLKRGPEAIGVLAQGTLFGERVDLGVATLDHQAKEAGAAGGSLDQRSAEVGTGLGALAHHPSGLLGTLAQQVGALGCLGGAVGGAELLKCDLVNSCDQALLAA